MDCDNRSRVDDYCRGVWQYAHVAVTMGHTAGLSARSFRPRKDEGPSPIDHPKGVVLVLTATSIPTHLEMGEAETQQPANPEKLFSVIRPGLEFFDDVQDRSPEAIAFGCTDPEYGE